MFNKKKKNNKGFTLVELLVVIAIIGILAVVAVPSLFKNIEKAKVADATSYISAYKSAAMSVYADAPDTVGEVAIEDDDIEGGQPTSIDEISAEIDNTTNKLLISVTLSDELSEDGKSKVGTTFENDSSVEID